MVDPFASVFGSVDLLSSILQYALSDAKDVPSVAVTCRHFNELVNLNPDTATGIWKHICVAQSPEIIRIYDLCKESEMCTFKKPGGGWKTLLFRSITSCYKPHGLNQRLQRSLELVFKQEGITAYSNCCARCTDSYEDCSAFTQREQGITFFKFFLNGMNYEGGDIYTAFVSYTNLDYLHKNWEGECDIIRRWCAVLGVKDYEVEKPESNDECIVIRFKQPASLEDYEYGTDDDYNNFDGEDHVEEYDDVDEETEDVGDEDGNDDNFDIVEAETNVCMKNSRSNY